MHPRIAELASFLDVERAGVEAALDAVPPRWRQRRQSAESWTAAEVVDHLARVELGIARLLARRAAKARQAGLGEDASGGSVLHCLDHDRILGTGKMVAPAMVRPGPDANAAEAVAALHEAHMELHAALVEADGLALGEIIQTHPTMGDLNLYQWVLFVGLHERRHAGQLRGIAEWSRAADAADAGGVAEGEAAHV